MPKTDQDQLPVVELDPEEMAALAYLKAKDTALEAIGSDRTGVAFKVNLPNDRRVLWASFAYLKRVHGLKSKPLASTGVSVWSLTGQKARIPVEAQGMESNNGIVVTVARLPNFTVNDLTDADYAVADKMIAARG